MSFAQDDRRNSQRLRDHAGCVVSMNGSMATLLDLSETGAKLDCRRAPKLEATVLLELPWGKQVRGQVVGTNGDIVRLQFDFPIEQPY